MNDAQEAFADAHPELGHLLVQVDTYYQSLPEPIRKAYDQLGSTLGYGCHCDLEDGQAPDGCVIDEGRPQDCIYAKKGMIKASCEYWRPIIPVVATKQSA